MDSEQYSYSCSLCGEALNLTCCNTDENGCAVHEQCYVAKLASDYTSSRPTSGRPWTHEDLDLNTSFFLYRCRQILGNVS